MRAHYTSADPLLALRPHLSKPQWHNLVLLVLALTIGRAFVLWQLAVAVLLPIRLESCYQRLKRLLRWRGVDLAALKRAWVRWVLGHFAAPGQPLRLLIDWTLHTDRCRSLWVQLVAGGGRSIPLAYWLAANAFGGQGGQRAFEDRALGQLQAWLPEGCQVILIGDRGFGGRGRMRFVAGLGWSFVFRVTGDARRAVRRRVRGRRGWRWRVHYERVDARPPGPGQRWRWDGVRYGRHRAVTVNLVASCRPAAGGGRSAVWYLATDLPAEVDVVALYGLRMQVEQSFRDYKASLGMEREYTRQPHRRLEWLLLALLVAAGRQAWPGRRALEQPRAAVAAAGGAGTPAEPAEAAGRPRYRNVSDWRRGWHEALTEVVLGCSEVRQAVQEAAAKAQRMQQRPQVFTRRKALPTRSRVRTAA
jgi:hypothetical protein